MLPEDARTYLVEALARLRHGTSHNDNYSSHNDDVNITNSSTVNDNKVDNGVDSKLKATTAVTARGGAPGCAKTSPQAQADPSLGPGSSLDSGAVSIFGGGGHLKKTKRGSDPHPRDAPAAPVEHGTNLLIAQARSRLRPVAALPTSMQRDNLHYHQGQQQHQQQQEQEQKQKVWHPLREHAGDSVMLSTHPTMSTSSFDHHHPQEHEKESTRDGLGRSTEQQNSNTASSSHLSSRSPPSSYSTSSVGTGITSFPLGKVDRSRSRTYSMEQEFSPVAAASAGGASAAVPPWLPGKTHKVPSKHSHVNFLAHLLL